MSSFEVTLELVQLRPQLPAFLLHFLVFFLCLLQIFDVEFLHKCLLVVDVVHIVVYICCLLSRLLLLLPPVVGNRLGNLILLFLFKLGPGCGGQVPEIDI